MRYIKAYICDNQGETEYKGMKKIIFQGSQEEVPAYDSKSQKPTGLVYKSLGSECFSIYECNKYYELAADLLQRCQEDPSYQDVICRLTVDDDGNIISINEEALVEEEDRVEDEIENGQDQNDESSFDVDDDSPSYGTELTLEDLYGPDLTNYPL